MCVCVCPSLQENPRIEFTRTIRRRINRQKTDQAKMRFLHYNAVYDRYDMVQPKRQLLPKLIAGFSGLVFMVKFTCLPPSSLCAPPPPPSTLPLPHVPHPSP